MFSTYAIVYTDTKVEQPKNNTSSSSSSSGYKKPVVNTGWGFSPDNIEFFGDSGSTTLKVDGLPECNVLDVKYDSVVDLKMADKTVKADIGFVDKIAKNDDYTLTVSLQNPSDKPAPGTYEGTITVSFTIKEYEARIGDEYYVTLEDAIDAAVEGTTVKLLKDAEVEKQINLPQGVTLDGGSHVIKANNTSWSTINGSKMLLELSSGTTVKNVTLDSNNQACGVQAYVSTDVKLENITLINSINAGLLINASQAELFGTIAMKDNEWGNYINLGWGSDITGAPDKAILTFDQNVVLDGVRMVWTGSDDLSRAEVTQENWDNKFVVSGMFAPITYGEGIAFVEPVARINDKLYATLDGAISGSNEGDTIDILKDITLSDTVYINSKKITINGNGFKLYGAGDYSKVAIKVTGANNSIVFKDIKLDHSIESSTTDSRLSYENIEITGAFKALHFNGENNCEVTISNSYLESVYPFNVNGGTVSSFTVSNTILNGWTSFGASIDEAYLFEDCSFGMGSGYATLKPYKNTVLNRCAFSLDYFQNLQGGIASGTEVPVNIYFNECKVDGKPLSPDTLKGLFNYDITSGSSAGSSTINQQNWYIDGEKISLTEN